MVSNIYSGNFCFLINIDVDKKDWRLSTGLFWKEAGNYEKAVF